MDGLNWLYKLHEAGLNGILADEMGLGKTIQSISIIAQIDSELTMEEWENRTSFHIVIVPKVTLNKWRKEFALWYPDCWVFTFYGNHDEKHEMKQTTLKEWKFDVILTTFEVAMAEKYALSKFRF